jgi:hypothetical protein
MMRTVWLQAGVVSVGAIHQSDLESPAPQAFGPVEQTDGPSPEIEGRDIGDPGIDKQEAGGSHRAVSSGNKTFWGDRFSVQIPAERELERFSPELSRLLTSRHDRAMPHWAAKYVTIITA